MLYSKQKTTYEVKTVLLSCININKSFTYDILKNANLTVAEGEKVGLIGVNGAGKSTLFKIITGELPHDGGQIVLKQNASVGYMRQTIESSPNTVYEELAGAFEHIVALEQDLETIATQITNATEQTRPSLIEKQTALTEKYETQGGYTYKSRLRGIINGLGFKEDAPISTLSGGQKTTLSMARLLLADSDLLLLDEPTNHLDLSSVAWLEGYLQNYKGAVVVISHDRYFINKIATKIVEVEHGSTTSYNGNYDAFVIKKQQATEIAQKHFDSQQQQIKEMEDSITLLKSFNREKSVKRARSKEKALDKIDRLDAPSSAPRSLRLELNANVQSGNDVLTLDNLAVPGLFDPISFGIKKGEKVALIGPVGIGKSTMFKAILERVPYTGEARFGTKVHTAYYEQHQEEALNLDNTIFEEIHNTYPTLKNLEIRNALASFTFIGDDVFKKISSLSGGEKAKVLLVKIMLSGSNLLMLDEPTNHLDIISKEILEEAIIEYDGTCFFISHDRYFINKIATKIIELSPQGVTTYLGNYDYYLEKKQTQAPSPTATTEKNTGALSWQEQKQAQAERRKIENKLKNAQKNIETLENDIEKLNEKLSDDSIAGSYSKLQEIYQEIEKKEEELLEWYEALEEQE